MNPTNVQEKIQKIETELEVLKRSVAVEPDFEVDEKTWQRLKPDVKKTRKALYKRTYKEA